MLACRQRSTANRIDRIAIGLCLGRIAMSDISRSAWLVLDNHRLASESLELLSKVTMYYVRAAAGNEPAHEPDFTRRIILFLRKGWRSEHRSNRRNERGADSGSAVADQALGAPPAGQSPTRLAVMLRVRL